MSLLEDWSHLSDGMKLHMRNRLAEACTERGLSISGITSPGQLAIEHDPTQVQRPHLEAIDDALTSLLSGHGHRLLITTPPQVGKLVADDEPVPTPTGWTRHGDLQVGDEVYHPSGKVITVTAVHAPDVATLRVRTSDGGSVVVHPRHEWTVWDRNAHQQRTLETRQIAHRKLTSGPIGSRGGRYVFQLPARDAMEGVSPDLPVDPYTLGVWLGDGTTTKPAITHHPDDHYVIPYPVSSVQTHRDTGVLTTYYRRLRADLVAAKVLGDKHIPMVYLRASESDRRALLAGLIDSDGTVARSGQVSFSNINQRLIGHVAELIRTLGYRVTEHSPIQPVTSSSGIVGKNVVYRLSFTPHDGVVPARLARKAAMCEGVSIRRAVAITAIEQVEPRPGRCITVDSPDGLYLVGRHMIPTHNSFRVSRWFPFWWLTMRPRDQIVLCSYAASLAHTHTAATRDLVAMYGAQHGLRLREGASRQSDWRVTAGGAMRGSGVKGGITGQPMDLGIIDDPYRDRAEADSPTIRAARWDWYSSAFSTRMSPHARVVLVLTRWHQDDLAGRLLDRDGRAEEGGKWIVVHLPAIAVAPNPSRGYWPDPLGRAPGEPLTHPKIDVDDRAGLITHWTNRRDDATSRDWTSMFQGSPVAAEGALLTEDDIVKATGRPSGEPRRIAVGIDPSGDGRDDAGIVAAVLDDNAKVWFTHDRTGKMTSDVWSREACLLAHEIGATRFVIEKNYGGGMATTIVSQAWDQLQREVGPDGQPLIPPTALCPLVQGVTARVSKVLRAEPIAQGIKTGRAGFASGADLSKLRAEWTQWEPGSTWSPGALDAAVHLATELMPAIPRGGLTEPVASIKQEAVVASEGSIASMKMR